jgi:hypothetical protein
VPIRASKISVDLAAGVASMVAQNVPVLDHGQIPNALSGMGPPPQVATVSFRVEWGGSTQRVPVNNAAQGFAGEYIRNNSQMEWSATMGEYEFLSAPLASSSSSFAEIGREHNGLFLNQ